MLNQVFGFVVRIQWLIHFGCRGQREGLCRSHVGVWTQDHSCLHSGGRGASDRGRPASKNIPAPVWIGMCASQPMAELELKKIEQATVGVSCSCLVKICFCDRLYMYLLDRRPVVDVCLCEYGRVIGTRSDDGYRFSGDNDNGCRGHPCRR